PIDQVPDRASHGIRLPFLGEAALVDRAPATLAWRSRATVLVVVAEYTEHGHAVRVVGKIAAPQEGDRARVWTHRVTAVATAALEAYVKSSPEAWLWLHRRWRL